MRYTAITNTTNLEARLAKALIESGALEKTTSTQDSSKPVKTKRNPKKIVHNICLVILGIIVAILIGMTIISARQQAEVQEINNLQDARLVSYESQAANARSLALLFAIYDDNSYQRAKANVKLSSDLYSSYFVNEHYTKTAEPIQITHQKVLYEITENDYVNYILYFEGKQGTTTKQYILQAEFVGDICTYFEVLN